MQTSMACPSHCHAPYVQDEAPLVGEAGAAAGAEEALLPSSPSSLSEGDEEDAPAELGSEVSLPVAESEEAVIVSDESEEEVVGVDAEDDELSPDCAESSVLSDPESELESADAPVGAAARLAAVGVAGPLLG